MKTIIKSIILSFAVTGILTAQNITNTLGTSGTFYIKNSSTNYFTLTQSTGQVNILNTLRLENTTASDAGVLYMGSDWFLHDYGSNNVFLGTNSGNFSMSGTNNAAIGQYTLYFNSSGSNNSAFGIYSLNLNSTGSQNCAFGYRSLKENTTGNDNSSFGYWSLYYNTTGYSNSAFGRQSSYNNQGGFENSAFGYMSLRSNANGDQNAAFGYQSLYSNTGNSNTAIGYKAGYDITSGTNNTCIGNNSQPSSSTVSNQITLGNNSITSLRCNVQSISSLSDERDKKNISDLSLGLDFLMKLKPRQFNWDKREWYENSISDGSRMQETKTAGFIAQELDETQATENAEWLNLVLKDNPEKIEATYGNLLPVMVKAIQELKAENDELKKEVENLKMVQDRVNALEKMVNELKQIKLTEK